ncbi:MAG TPA: hypothetical protein VF424_13950 [Vicinamibacterales bacterium]
MSDFLHASVDAGIPELSPFPPNSRYHGVTVERLNRPEREPIPYLRRRFVPPPESFVVIQEHAVVYGDRLDSLAARYLGDPELWWRLADANGAMRPDELVETLGRPIVITLPQGIPGVPGA